jgi:polysaccharide biosynthesis transport protein
MDLELSPAHYLQLIVHRKWLVASIFVVVSAATAITVQMLPNIYTSETVILVDPQKVPESYVKATVTGDLRNRLGTLTQQILSATRLQKIIETDNLYPEERKKLAREDVIARMRADINESIGNGGGAQQDLLSFRISYSGKDPQLVAQVTNQIAAMFIEENLKVREQQAMGTTEFLQHQMEETRKTLESQEAQLRDFRLKHLGEMPEHQVANLTVLGQLQASLQQEGEALGRAEQQRTYYQTMMAQYMPVVDLDGADEGEIKAPASGAVKSQAPSKTAAAAPSSLNEDKARLAALLSRYQEIHPEVRKLRQQIAEKEAKERLLAPPPPPTEVTTAAQTPRGIAGEGEPPVPVPPAKKRAPFVPPVNSTNPVLLSQLKGLEAEIAKHKEEQLRLNRLIAGYQAKLEAIPVREQQIAELVRDYEINKLHYGQLLNNQLSAETATQLEIRQKGERFSILDPAQAAQRPSKPNRPLINIAGSLGGLILGVLFAIGSEFFGMSITSPEQIPQQNGNQVLEIIPMILTEAERKRKRKQLIMAAVSGAAATVAFCGVILYHYRG